MRKLFFWVLIVAIVGWSAICLFTIPTMLDECRKLGTALGATATSPMVDTCIDAAIMARLQLWGVPAIALGVFALLVRPRAAPVADLPVRSMRQD